MTTLTDKFDNIVVNIIAGGFAVILFIPFLILLTAEKIYDWYQENSL